MGLEKELNRYYKEINRHLTCPKKEQEEFLTEVHHLVDDFLGNQPEASYTDLVEAIGEPGELAATMLKTLPDQTVVQTYRRKRKMRTGIIIGFLVLVIAALCFMIDYIGHMRANTIITEETTTIIEPETTVS